MKNLKNNYNKRQYSLNKKKQVENKKEKILIVIVVSLFLIFFIYGLIRGVAPGYDNYYPGKPFLP